MTKADEKQIQNICKYRGLNYFAVISKIYDMLNDKNLMLDEEDIINYVIEEQQEEKENKFKYAYSATVYVKAWNKAYTYEVEENTKVNDTVYVITGKGEVLAGTVEEIFVSKGYPYQLKKVITK